MDWMENSNTINGGGDLGVRARMKTIFESGTLTIIQDRNRDELQFVCGEDGWVRDCDAVAGALALLKHLTYGYIGGPTKGERCDD